MLKLLRTSTTQTTAPSASDLQARLDAAKASHAQLTADHATASYEVVMGAPDAAERQDALATELAGVARTIGTLEAAIGVARQREAEAARQRRIAGQAAQIERVTKILHRRARYAQQLTDAIAETVRLYRLLADNSERAGIAYPNGEGPAGAALSGKEIQRLVAHELFRQGGAGPLSQDPLPPFPGGTWPSIDLMGQPDRVTPLVKSIADANAYAVAVMRGEAPDVPADLVAADSVEEPEEPETAEAIPAGPLTDASAYTPVRVRMS